MKKLFSSKRAKAIVDILLFISAILLMTAGSMSASASYWNSPHCIFGSVLSLLIVIHVAQHWRLIRAFLKKKVVFKNKITAVTVLCFALIFISIISFIVGTSLTKFHNVIGHVIILIIIIHIIDKFKRFKALFSS